MTTTSQPINPNTPQPTDVITDNDAFYFDVNRLVTRRLNIMPNFNSINSGEHATELFQMLLPIGQATNHIVFYYNTNMGNVIGTTFPDTQWADGNRDRIEILRQSPLPIASIITMNVANDRDWDTIGNRDLSLLPSDVVVSTSAHATSSLVVITPQNILQYFSPL